jgi:hypothetical protein
MHPDCTTTATTTTNTTTTVRDIEIKTQLMDSGFVVRNHGRKLPQSIQIITLFHFTLSELAELRYLFNLLVLYHEGVGNVPPMCTSMHAINVLFGILRNTQANKQLNQTAHGG